MPSWETQRAMTRLAVNPRVPRREQSARVGSMRPHVQSPEAECIVGEELLSKEHRRGRRLWEHGERDDELHADQGLLSIGSGLVDELLGVMFFDGAVD